MSFADFVPKTLPPKAEPKTLAQLNAKKRQLAFAFPLPQKPKGSRSFAHFVRARK
jgi:hypothetical protein